MRRFEAISVSIARPYEDVYAFLANPRNLFSWASVMGTKHHPVAPLEWVAEEPTFIDQPVTLIFSPRNAYGVLDFTALVGGQVIYAAPVRAVRNDEGTEVTIGVFMQPGGNEESFRSEIEWMRADLLVVKSLLEAG